MMITDTIVEAMDMMIDMCGDKKQAAGMSSLREFLCDLDEDEWMSASFEERFSKIKPFISCKVKKISE